MSVRLVPLWETARVIRAGRVYDDQHDRPSQHGLNDSSGNHLSNGAIVDLELHVETFQRHDPGAPLASLTATTIHPSSGSPLVAT